MLFSLSQDIRASKENGLMGDCSTSSLSPLGPSLKDKRTLKGHFGKVYAMHWSGDSIHLGFFFFLFLLSFILSSLL